MNKHPRTANSGEKKPLIQKPMTIMDWFGLSCLILLAACSLILFIQLLTTKMLPNGLLIVLIILLALLNAGHLIVQLPRRANKLPKLICGIVSLLLSGVMIYAVSATDSVQSALLNISGKLVEKDVTYVLVLEDNSATDIGDAVGYNYGTLSHADAKNTAALMEAVKAGMGELKNTPYNSVTGLVDALYSGEVDAIMLNEGYISMLENMEEYADFSKKTRSIYEFTTEREVAAIKPNPAITREPFVIYCSGIDARNSDISVNSLSDVNILAVVNPTSHQILLLNTPRDYYVPLVSEPYTGMLDKLTHAGSLGIDESMKVLGQLYGVEPTYFARINFLGLVDIVDALGGIDVVSPFDFTAEGMNIYEGGYRDVYYYHFTEGVNHINGNEALAFSRERSAFGDGDNQRGKNQMAVIKGIVDKATSPQILTSYSDVLKAVEGCFTTNMPYEDMSALVKMQLRDMSGWNITSYAVSGDGDLMPCATMGDQNLWVMWPDEDMIATAKAMVQQVLDGEVPTEPAD